MWKIFHKPVTDAATAAGLAVGGDNHLQVVAVTPDGTRTVSSGRLFLAGA